jgi:hypothetical protein
MPARAMPGRAARYLPPPGAEAWNRTGLLTIYSMAQEAPGLLW